MMKICNFENCAMQIVYNNYYRIFHLACSNRHATSTISVTLQIVFFCFYFIFLFFFLSRFFLHLPPFLFQDNLIQSTTSRFLLLENMHTHTHTLRYTLKPYSHFLCCYTILYVQYNFICLVCATARKRSKKKYIIIKQIVWLAQ